MSCCKYSLCKESLAPVLRGEGRVERPALGTSFDE